VALEVEGAHKEEEEALEAEEDRVAEEALAVEVVE